MSTDISSCQYCNAPGYHPYSTLAAVEPYISAKWQVKNMDSQEEDVEVHAKALFIYIAHIHPRSKSLHVKVREGPVEILNVILGLVRL